MKATEELLQEADEIIENEKEARDYILDTQGVVMEQSRDTVVMEALADKLREQDCIADVRNPIKWEKTWCKCELPRLNGKICKQCQCVIETPSGE